MAIIEYADRTSEALKVYFEEPNRWKDYIVALGKTSNFKDHKRWFLYFFSPQLWEEKERRSPGSKNQEYRESLFYLNFQIIKLKAQGIEPPEDLVRRVAKKQREFNESERKHWQSLKWDREERLRRP